MAERADVPRAPGKVGPRSNPGPCFFERRLRAISEGITKARERSHLGAPADCP
jgi:hypothetical protein